MEGWKMKHSLEPAVFLNTFAWGLQMVVSQDLLIDKTCRDLHYSEDVCKNINNHGPENDEVQKKVATLQMYMSLVSALPSIVISLFAGPWSDRNGRKPVMLIPMIGYFASEVAWILNVYFWDASAYWLIGTCIASFFGGFTCFLIGIFSFLSDVTSTRARTTRIAILDLALFAGLPAGSLVSGYLYSAAGFYGIFATTLGCQMLSGLYVALVIEDTRCIPLPTDENLSSKIRRYVSIADYHHLLDVFRTTFKKRRHNLREVIILLILLMLLNVTVFSDGGIFYLYARREFGWDEQQYSKFQTLVICISAVASLVVMPLLSYVLRVEDAMIGILATLSKISSLIVMSMASTGYTLFFGASLGCISSLSGVVIRSLLSKCVKHSELGKVNSLLASLEAAVPLFASPLMTAVYSTTLETHPGAVFLVQAGIFLVASLIFTYVFYILVRTGQDFSLQSSAEEEEEETLLRDPSAEHTY